VSTVDQTNTTLFTVANESLDITDKFSNDNITPPCTDLDDLSSSRLDIISHLLSRSTDLSEFDVAAAAD